MAAGGKDIQGLTVQRYQEVIDAVVGKVRADFNQEGVDESILDEVRALWEAKLVATGVIGLASDEGQQVIQQQQLQATRVGAPGALPALTPAQQQQLLAMRAAAGVTGALPVGMPHMLVPGAAPMQQQHLLAMLQVQAQAQAAAHAQVQAAQAAAAAEQKRKLDVGVAGAPEAKQQRTIPQQDGPADDPGEEGGEEAAGGDDSGAAGAAAAEEEEEDDDPLTEDEDGSGDEVDEAAVADVVLGQFEKVQRSKAKWKIALKDCIVTLNGRDYLVRKMTGEMDFL